MPYIKFIIFISWIFGKEKATDPKKRPVKCFELKKKKILFIFPANDHSDHGHWDQRTVVKALYAYMPSGENQLPFEEGDRIALVGGKAKGWQFGENLRTQMFGWFPVAYTNADLITETKMKSERERSERSNDRYENMHYERQGATMRNSYHENYNDMENQQEMESDSTYRRDRHEETSPTRMFGDTYRNQKKVRIKNYLKC